MKLPFALWRLNEEDLKNLISVLIKPRSSLGKLHSLYSICPRSYRLLLVEFRTWPLCKSCCSCQWTLWTLWRRCRVRCSARRRSRAQCWPQTAGSSGTMPCSLMSYDTFDLEAQVMEVVGVEARRNEERWRKAVEVVVSKLSLCGRIIQTCSTLRTLSLFLGRLEWLHYVKSPVLIFLLTI